MDSSPAVEKLEHRFAQAALHRMATELVPGAIEIDQTTEFIGAEDDLANGLEHVLVDIATRLQSGVRCHR